MSTFLIFLLVLVAFVGIMATLVYLATSFSRTGKGPLAASVLAQRIGWVTLTPGRPPQDAWYGGLAHGRSVAFRLATLPQSPEDQLPYLRVVMQVAVRQPLGIEVVRDHFASVSVTGFGSAFRTTKAECIGPVARQAPLTFAATGAEGGATNPAVYQNLMGSRNLRLIDRVTASPHPLDPGVLPHAHAVLIHDHPRCDMRNTEFGTLLLEMASVAYAIEQGR